MKPIMIAIAGPSGSGKTSLTVMLMNQLPNGHAVQLSSDRYYKDLSHLTPEERNAVNFDHPDSIDTEALVHDLRLLREGQAIDAPNYDFATHTRTQRTTRIEPKPYVIVEGILLLALSVCRDLFDLKIFSSAPNDICLMRRVNRDVAHRGRTQEQVVEQYHETVEPMQKKFVDPSAQHADVQLDTISPPSASIDKVMEILFKQGEKRYSTSGRLALIDELERRYGGVGKRRWHYLWKKYSWIWVVESAKVLKRALDILISIAVMIMFFPFFLAICLAIKFTDRGPIFYVQTRVGKWGREFPFPKFRSMVANADALKDKLLEQNQHGQEGVTFKMKHDPRITWIGRILRRTSLDEMPQFWSVLRGDMTLVGPRPPVPREVALYTLADRRRLNVKPGITCIWQVSGRSDIPFPQQVELDVQYIESQSLWLDIKLLFKTIPAVLMGRGAY